MGTTPSVKMFPGIWLAEKLARPQSSVAVGAVQEIGILEEPQDSCVTMLAGQLIIAGGTISNCTTVAERLAEQVFASVTVAV